MAVLGFPSVSSPRTFPLAPSARIFPLSSPSAGLSTIPFTGTTLATILTRIRERLFNTFWTDAELTLYIQEGLRIWNTLTGYYRERASPTLSASQTHYTTTQVIEDALAILRIDTAAAHLDPASIEAMGAFIPTYQSTAATAAPSQWIPISLNLFALYPQASGSFAVTIDYARFAPIPTATDDYVQLGEEDMTALIDYVVFIAKLKEGGKEAQEAVVALKSFLRQAAKYNARLEHSSIFRKLMGHPDGGEEQQRPAAAQLKT